VPAVPSLPVSPVSLRKAPRKAPRKAVSPEPVERRSVTRQLIGVVVVLLVGALIAGLLALDDDGDRAISRFTSASPTPAPAATGPFGNLSVRRDPDRSCLSGSRGPNAFYLDMPLILNWTTPRGSPTPASVIVELEITAGGEVVGPARYNHPENLRPAAPTADGRAIDGYYRITFDGSLLGVTVRVTVRIEADREVRDTDSLDNQFGVRVDIPAVIAPEVRVVCYP
jgi:hypothetical protein